MTLPRKGTFKIKATLKPVKKGKAIINKSHASLRRYISSNTNVATVTKKGKIKAKATGKCKIYVVGVNGLWKVINVTVK